MYHFFTEPENIGEDSIRIVGNDVNHIKNVLRMKPGEEILISNKKDKDYRCRIRTITQQEVEAEILSADENGTELPVRIHLYQGLPKSDKMELIIQKAVELGVYRIIPVVTARTIVKLDAKKEESRIRRWNTISESAAKQSKRILIPEVAPVMSLKQALEDAGEFSLRLLPYENAKGMAETRNLFGGIRPGTDVAVFIGPEGGFEEAEAAYAASQGAFPITLGKRILRTETAGMAVLAMLVYQLEQD